MRVFALYCSSAGTFLTLLPYFANSTIAVPTRCFGTLDACESPLPKPPRAEGRGQRAEGRGQKAEGKQIRGAEHGAKWELKKNFFGIRKIRGWITYSYVTPSLLNNYGTIRTIRRKLLGMQRAFGSE